MGTNNFKNNDIRTELTAIESAFEEQDTLVRHFVDTQAKQIALDLTTGKASTTFSLPDKVLAHTQNFSHPVVFEIPQADRSQSIRIKWYQKGTARLKDAVSSHLRTLEQSPDRALALCGSLLRYKIAESLITNILPTGRQVSYLSEWDETIPSLPARDDSPASAITQASDAITEEGSQDGNRGELQTPFTPDARRFFLPQWIAFDLNGSLIASNHAEALAMIASMQNFIEILHKASSLAPLIVYHPEYQRKRYGILGQLVNQGRALAIYETNEIINNIQTRADSGTLNRGLSISLPYFNDQELKICNLDFQVIPAGRIMFIPAFVIRAVQGEIAKVQQDTRLNSSTRRHLLRQLEKIQQSFESK